MGHDTATECLLFPDIFAKPVVAQFDQRQGSSDGGALLLKAADRRLGLTETLANCLVDQRQVGKIDHEMEELLRQRIFGIACGYADANDAARLAEDPVHKMLVGRVSDRRTTTWHRSRRCRALRMRWTASSFTGWARRWPSA